MFKKRKLLAVTPNSTNYCSFYRVSIAYSFEQAKEMIISAESASEPFDDLDLPVYDERVFWNFVEWMEMTDRKYPFSIFGYKDSAHFCSIADSVRHRGFHFNS